MRLWIICYDIADARSRRRIADALANAGAQRLQESVFEGRFLHRDMVSLFARIAPMVRDDGGHLRIYPISSAGDSRKALGRMPAEVGRPEHWLC